MPPANRSLTAATPEPDSPRIVLERVRNGYVVVPVNRFSESGCQPEATHVFNAAEALAVFVAEWGTAHERAAAEAARL